MRVLIGFEESGTIREAFRELDHFAWSCDLNPARDSSKYHLQCDIYEAIESGHWDLIILHPVCTSLTVAGNHVYAKGKPKHHERTAAIEYVYRLWRTAKYYAKKVALENPQGVIHTNTDLPKPQYIQPYQFGEDASKKTGLTLQNLPKLVPTKRIYGRMVCKKCKGITPYQFAISNAGCMHCWAVVSDMVERWDNQTDSGQNKLGPSPTRARDRSKTYQGIADAMAAQWG